MRGLVPRKKDEFSYLSIGPYPGGPIWGEDLMLKSQETVSPADGKGPIIIGNPVGLVSLRQGDEVVADTEDPGRNPPVIII